MVNMTTILNTLETTNNFWEIASLKRKSKCRIQFRNGFSIMLNWAEYCRMRDLMVAVKRLHLAVKKQNNRYVITNQDKTPKFKFLDPSSKNISLLEFAMQLHGQDWAVDCSEEVKNLITLQNGNRTFTIQQMGDDLYSVEATNFKMTCPMEAMIGYFNECEKGIYDYDYRGKTVLDVGGFCGETAVFFKSRGASKVIVYEPVLAHNEFIKQNIALNSMNAELHTEGIGEGNCEKTIHYDSTNMAFGVLSTGTHEMNIKIRDTAEVLQQSGADVAKIDCEGAELTLVNVPKEILRAVKAYMIETHTAKIRALVEQKFYESGFKQLRAPIALSPEVSVIFFEGAD
jgi:FkbM family methyltransferase